MTNMLVKIQDMRRRPYIDWERDSESVRKEEYLQKQIEDLKETARQRQQSLEEKDMRIRELRQVMEEKDLRLKELQRIVEEQDEMAGKMQEILNMHNSMADMNQSLNAAKKELSEKLTASSLELSDKIDAARNELSEKVHTENVKCYRNVQALTEELGKKLDENTTNDSGVKSIKRYLRAAILLGIINLGVVIGMILYESGIINYLLY